MLLCAREEVAQGIGGLHDIPSHPTQHIAKRIGRNLMHAHFAAFGKCGDCAGGKPCREALTKLKPGLGG